MYELMDALEEHLELIKKYKLNTIMEYATDIEEEEKNKIIKYVNTHVKEDLKKYKIIVTNFDIIGCLLVVNYEDGIMLDEIYLEEDYRNQGIGSKILQKLINENDIIYLWVYKNNEKAIELYTKLNFKIINETDTRYFMKSTNS